MSEANISMGTPGSIVVSEPMFSVPAKKLAIWLFIIADAATFAGCLVVYGFLRNASQKWPTPFETPSVINAAIMTFVLVTSSLTMLLGVRAAKAQHKSAAIRWTLVTVVLGILFALLHIREWLGMIREGVTLFHNPWGDPQFGATFYSITGLHLLHVTGGVLVLLWVTYRYNKGRFNGDDLEVAGLYWHFVDLVWMFVVPLVYLLNVAH